ncbi:Peptidyl-prolyl cis-trans isomerase [Lunatimonas lonarensis]|uniref:Peptidyl-prolyl cis-trans isomerase n=1 Tax=Lunatimonas lonarensis TaxID=1232681 RepID=R7ZTP9_9BACT|nr:FKBP-type peptidyl-prolyl cis-trans isomerase [Lunatimonas lonarensis]EON77374.1 Peptidyl-prolyl cis-trans isomerase [Lunatimonas lonarensis]
MKNISLSVLLLIGLSLVFSCVSEDENMEVIFQRDKQTIDTFVQNFDEEYVRREVVGETGVTLLFLETNGAGRRPEIRDTLYVDYIGFFLDGTVFDTSVEQVARDNGIFNQSRSYVPFPVELGVSFVIDGWHIALSQMREGEKAIALIPSIYAYGSQGNHGIPPNTVLAFELDVKSVRGPSHSQE